MLGWITSKTESLAQKFVREKIKGNTAYAGLKWNFLERKFIRFASSPLKSVFVMLTAALLLVCTGFFSEEPVKQYLSAYTPFRRSVFEWQTTILSGQLTIIGIVYPLVIGLVSVVFQKKADRKIAQKAYQLYSGFMLAGLSGLFLSAFILIGTIVRVLFGDYLYGIVCLISEAWLFINILLSVWFFIVSLEILDDAKRLAVIQRYITSEIAEKFVFNKISGRLRLYPVYPEKKFSNIEIKTFDPSEDCVPVYMDLSKNDILSVYHRPFRMILNIVNFFLKRKGVYAAIITSEYFMSRSESEKKVAFFVRNISPDGFITTLLKRCFYKADISSETDTVNVIIQFFMADIYSSLHESDVIGFDHASDSLIENFTSLCDAYDFIENGVTKNFLQLKTELFEFDTPTAFSNEIDSASGKAMNMIADSERFFEICLWYGIRIMNNRKSFTPDELDIYMGITRSHWYTLTAWNKKNQPLSNATVSERYERLIRTFSSVWEKHHYTARYRFHNAANAELYFMFCKNQLQDLPVMVIDAVQTRDRVTVDAAVDLLNRWQHSMEIDDFGERYSYKGQLYSPGLFLKEKLNCITDQNRFSLALINALTDMRICVSLYLTSRMNVQDKFITHYVRLILQGQLTDRTGGYETRTEKVDDAGQLIKFLIRICLWTWSEKMEWGAWLNQLSRRMSDYDKPAMVSGRSYSGVMDSGFADMVPAWVQLLLMVSGKASRANYEILQALENDYFTYREKQRILRVLTEIHSEIDKTACSRHLEEDHAADAKEYLRSVLSEYIDMFQNDLTVQLHEAVIDKARLSLTAQKTTESLFKRLYNLIPFSLFTKISALRSDDGEFMPMKSVIETDKESYAEGIDDTYVIDEGNIPADCMADRIKRGIIRKLFDSTPSRIINIEDFSVIIDYIKSSPDMAGKVLLIMSRDIFEQYNRLIFERPDFRSFLKSNRDGSKTVSTEYGICTLFFMQYVNKPFTLVVDEDYFTSLSLREYDDGSVVDVTSENVAGASSRLNLILDFEVGVTFKGDVGLRMEHPLSKKTV